ncbi:MAG TPA: ATP-binding protein [Candidatus Binatia bacterium]|nr:ATP-binding protein [Candidatus Binatia bacterium]
MAASGASSWQGYAVAIGGVTVVIAGRLLADRWLGDAMPFGMLTVVVAAAAALGGLAPGFLAAGLGLVASAFFILPPRWTFAGAWETQHVIATSGYAASTIAVTVLAHYLRRTRARAEETMAGLLREQERLRQSEERIRVSEERLAMAIEVGGIAIWDHDVERGTMTWTERHFTVLGLDPTSIEPTYERWRDSIHPEDRARVDALYQQARQDGATYIAEYRIVRPDGGVRWLSARGRFLYDVGRPVRSIGAMVDVTARVEAEQALRVADRRKDEFLAMLAHELRNPLGPIRNAAALLEALGPDDARVTRARAVIERQTTHMARLVDDLLDVARITRGVIELRSDLLELDDVVAQAVDQVRPAFDARGLTLAVSTALEPIVLEGDGERLLQVLANLLGNACKFTPAGGRVSITTSRLDDRAVIRVRDDGIGIDPALLPSIFDLFVQGSMALDRSMGGLGIGLTLARRMVELHGGTIAAHSAGPGQGSELVVTLPLATQTPRRLAAGPEAAASTGVEVLIVEDNADAAESLRLLLELDGHVVRIAGTGPAALAAVDAAASAVAFVDIGLPEMDGFEVARRLRVHPNGQTMVLVAVSGYGRDEDKRRAAAAGFDHHFTKPVDFDDVRRILQGIAGDAPARPRVLTLVRDR